jgi:membrane protein YdbS with pleckstrin-like domain
MLYDQNPVHRKLITPWYDSRAVCLVVILSMLLVLLFALVGVYFAWENTLYREMIWLPALLALLSGIVILSTTVRLVKRRKHRYARNWEYW